MATYTVQRAISDATSARYSAAQVKYCHGSRRAFWRRSVNFWLRCAASERTRIENAAAEVKARREWEQTRAGV